MKLAKGMIVIQMLLLGISFILMFEYSNENQYLKKELNVYRSAYENVVEQPKKESIYEIAERIYDVEAELLIAIELHETGNYTSELLYTNCNTWGAHDSKQYKVYGNVEESTLDLARCLRVYYYNYGLTTLEQIATEFCPTDIEGWVADVKQIYEEVKE